MNSHEIFIHIHQGCFAGTGAIVRLPQCQWSRPYGYGKVSQCITTTEHGGAGAECMFLGICCIFVSIYIYMCVCVCWLWYLSDIDCSVISQYLGRWPYYHLHNHTLERHMICLYWRVMRSQNFAISFICFVVLHVLHWLKPRYTESRSNRNTVDPSHRSHQYPANVPFYNRDVHTCALLCVHISVAGWYSGIIELVHCGTCPTGILHVLCLVSYAHTGYAP